MENACHSISHQGPDPMTYQFINDSAIGVSILGKHMIVICFSMFSPNTHIGPRTLEQTMNHHNQYPANPAETWHEHGLNIEIRDYQSIIGHMV